MARDFFFNVSQGVKDQLKTMPRSCHLIAVLPRDGTP
jgi:hypothetical protein